MAVASAAAIAAGPNDALRNFDPDALFRIVDVAGVVANGILGGALARRLGYDLVGFVVLGMASGLAGGALRDVLIGHGTAVMLTDPAYLTGAIVAASLSYVIDIRSRFAGRVLTILDLLALGCWSATGAAKALGVGLGWVPAVMLGVVTAVGGGVVRDVLVGRVPAIFGGNPLYASVALIGSAEMTAFTLIGRTQLGMAAAILSCAALGLLARHRGWTLPGAADWSDRHRTLRTAISPRHLRKRPNKRPSPGKP